MKKARVLIVGGGFSGLAAAKELDRMGVSTMLVDRHAHHLFQPLLYQVAAAGLSAPSVAAPLRHTLKKARHVQVIQATVEQIDSVGKRALIEDMGWLDFEAMLICSGSTHSYFGQDEWSKFAPGLKTLEDAMDIRARILGAFEHAEKLPEGPERDAWMTFVIVGAGPTGVEMAGSLSEIACHALSGEFHSIDPSKARIVIIEGGSRPLSMLAPSLSERAAQDLASMGVELIVSAQATSIDADGINYAKDGVEHRLAARVCLWAAGVKATELGAMSAKGTQAEIDRSGRVVPMNDLSLKGAPMVFVAGDLVSLQSHGKPVPGVAPAAKQMGLLAARNIKARLDGQLTKEFVYADYGSMATIGRHRAVVEMGPFRFAGYCAWMFWLLAHIWFLIGWRSRLMVMLDWGWAYFTKQRWSRVVLSPLGRARASEEIQAGLRKQS